MGKDINKMKINKPLKEDRQTTALTSNGIYSVMNSTWIKKPQINEIPDISQEQVNQAAEQWIETSDSLIERANRLIRLELKNPSTETLTEEEVKTSSNNAHSTTDNLLKDAWREVENYTICNLLKDEWEAVENYKKAQDNLNTCDRESFEDVIRLLDNISEEEQQHVGELETTLAEIDKKSEENIENGKAEAEELLSNPIETEPHSNISTEICSESTKEIEKLIAEIDTFIQTIYKLRKESIASEGEYSIGNLVFKEIRNSGRLDTLKQLKNHLASKKLSLESLQEDTEKEGNKWVNRGDSGETHGEFKTKKAADAQRKAMFANGYSK